MPPLLPAVTDAASYKRYFNDDLWLEAAKIICARHRLSHRALERSAQGESVIFFVNSRYVIKIFAPFRNIHLREKVALEFVVGCRLAVKTPEIVFAGDIEDWSYIVTTRLSGVLMRDVWRSIEEAEQIKIVECLGAWMRELHACDAAPLSNTALNRNWSEYVEQKSGEAVERQTRCGANPEWLESLPDYIAERINLLPKTFNGVLLHGDIHPGNVLLEEKGAGWQVSGVFDFGDSFCGFHEYDFVAPGVLMVQGKPELQRAHLLAYGYRESELDLNLRARLMLLTIFYECSDLRKYALRLAPEAVNFTLAELEAAIWRFASN